MNRVHKLAIVGAHRSGKTEAALAYALLAARRGPVMFICENDVDAKQLRSQVMMEAESKPLLFCGLSRFVLVSAFALPFQTIVVDAVPSSVATKQISIFAARAAAHHGEAWLAATHATPA
ncbi:hypothetical protein [Roseomonas xinghualingensis]|uniref:hypothetical protein n=1 Tax=Roseomonas xinghualingensis TaxID=2986475 RepID=UPI0021F1B48B|nr:hypothetical protein [Roseomonas sp. SXEYE001]MCV4206906.1 hypothetical protein [Roseomonas sp. SXEYE001]